jgi:hypothetical protein
MKTLLSRLSVAVLLAAAAPLAAAHDLQCEKTVGVVLRGQDGGPLLGEDGLPIFAADPAVTLSVNAYPALVAFRVSLTNVAADVSVVGSATDTLLDPLAGTLPSFGASFTPGFALDPGETAERIVVLPVPSYEACLALGGEPGDLVCRPDGTLENRFVVTHEVGMSECRARLVCLPPACDAPAWTGVRQFGSAASDRAFALSVDADNEIHVGGGTFGDFAATYSGGPGTDAFLATLDESGALARTLQWREAESPTSVEGLVTAPDGTVLVATSAGPGHVSKIDDANAFLWSVPGTNPVPDVDVDAAGNAYGITTTSVLDVRVVKIDPAGTTLWSEDFGTDAQDSPQSVAVTPAGEAYVTGYTQGAFAGETSAGGTDAFVAKLDATGNVLWVRQLGSAATDLGTGVAVDALGNVAVTGFTEGALEGETNAGGADAFVAVFDTAGTLLWTDQLGSPGDDRGQGVGFDASGALWVVGEASGALPGATALGFADAFVARYTLAGTQEWVRQYGTAQNDVAYDVDFDACGSAYVAGYTGGSFGGTSAGGLDAFVMRLDASGDL